MQVAVVADFAVKVVSLILTQSRIPSAIPTASFQLHVPGLSEYQMKPNYYPKRDNATITAVSSPTRENDTFAPLFLRILEISGEGMSRIQSRAWRGKVDLYRTPSI